MRIGEKTIDGWCALAPMAGVADAAFRELCVSYGAAVCTTEMISAKALTMGDKKSMDLMRIGDGERPCGVQIFGSDPAVMAEGAGIAMGVHPDFIDVNMGCPAPKIVKNGAGSALLRDPALAGSIVRAVKNAVSLPVGVKFRIGWDADSVHASEFARVLADNGADFLTVHGRTKAQMYAPPVNLEQIAAVKKSVGIPVIGNGDIFTPEDAKAMLSKTGCDFLMVGRGCLGRPWLFRMINEYLETGHYAPAPENEEKMRVMMAHAERICALKGEKNGVNEVRKHALWYTKGIRGSAKLRNAFSTVESLAELRELAAVVCGEAG